MGYITLGKACSSSNRASFIPISRISTNLRHQLYNNTRQGQGRELWGTIECHHFSGFPVGILTPPAWAAWPRRPGLSWPSEPWCQTQKLATIWWASLTTFTAKKARIIVKFQASQIAQVRSKLIFCAILGQISKKFCRSSGRFSEHNFWQVFWQMFWGFFLAVFLSDFSGRLFWQTFRQIFMADFLAGFLAGFLADFLADFLSNIFLEDFLI